MRSFFPIFSYQMGLTVLTLTKIGAGHLFACLRARIVGHVIITFGDDLLDLLLACVLSSLQIVPCLIGETNSFSQWSFVV